MLFRSPAAAQKIAGQARLLANKQVYGEDGANIFNTLMPLYQSEDPKMLSHANAMLSIIANQIHDTVDFQGAPHSSTKLNVRKMGELVNKALVAQGLTPMSSFIKEEGKRGFNTAAVHTGSDRLTQLALNRTRIFLADRKSVV